MNNWNANNYTNVYKINQNYQGFNKKKKNG